MTATDQLAALRDLRRTRQLRRLGDTEWFDVAYRVYLFALVGLIGVVVASDAIGGVIGDDVSTSDLVTRGPSIAGIVVAVAIGLGARSGSDGGPVSIETADVAHLLLAPIDRRRVLIRPVGQRIRSAMFALALGVAVLGQFVAREVEGSRAAWAAAGAAFGAIIGAAFVTTAVLSHTLRLSRSGATAIATIIVAWQSTAAWAAWTDAASPLRVGPTNLAGSIALWGIRQRTVDLVAVVVVACGIGASLALSGRLRIEPLVRRGELVSQLRFATTVQDLRTVVLLRRQLRSETLRSTPWGGRRSTPVRDRVGARPISSTRTVIWRRGIQSLRRLPASRLGRILALSIAAGVCGSLTVTSSWLFLIGVLGALFILGLESIEPLSQEVDRPDRTDALPTERGWLFAQHLAAPAALLAVAGLVAAAAATVLESTHAAGAFAVAIPSVWAGAIGPVVATVRDSPAPIATAETSLLGAPRSNETSLVPPEFAGFSTAFSTFLPVVTSAVGVLPVVAMRVEPSAATAVRCTVGIALVVAATIVWIHRRDAWGVKIRAFFEAGREQKAAMS